MRAEDAAGHWSRTIAATDMAFAQVGLVDGPEHDGLSRLVRLAADLIGAPMALVTVVQPALNRQFLAAAHGVDGPLAEVRQTPMSYSFCQHVCKRRRSLIISDARRNVLVSDNPAVEELGVLAYLGVPIRWPDGTVIGALCVTDRVPRGWTAAELERLTMLAHCVDDQIRLLLSLHDERAARTRAELASTARDLMLREANHEFRTPLNGIVGAADVLVETELDSEQRQFVDMLRESANQLTRIVGEIASLTSDLTLPQGRRSEEFDPSQVLGEVIGLLSHRGCDCTLKRPPDGAELRTRIGDTLLLRHVLYDALRTASTAWPSAMLEIGVDDSSADVLGISLCSRPQPGRAGPPPVRGGRALAAELRVARRVARAMGGSLRLELSCNATTTAVMVLRMPFPAVDARLVQTAGAA